MTASIKHVAFCPTCGVVSGYLDDEAEVAEAVRRHNSSNHNPDLPQKWTNDPTRSAGFRPRTRRGLCV